MVTVPGSGKKCRNFVSSPTTHNKLLVERVTGGGAFAADAAAPADRAGPAPVALSAAATAATGKALVAVVPPYLPQN